MPNGRCKNHGGKSKSGIAAGRYDTGRYSKYIPARLSERYELALDDPQMLEQRNEIALLEMRSAELLESLGTMGSRDWAQELGKAWAQFRHYAEVRNQEKAQEKFYELDDLIMMAADDVQIWEEIHGIVDLRRRVVESERKRIIEAQEFVMIQDAMALARALVAAINQHVKDDRIKQLIQSDIIEIYSRQ